MKRSKKRLALALLSVAIVPSVALATTVFFVLCLLLVAGLIRQAEAAHIVCGQTLGPGGLFVLDSNVGPCDDPGPAIEVESATLDLNGFTVSCADTNANNILPDGIVLIDSKAVVLNGTVSGCNDGVLVEGFRDQSKHRVENVTSDANANNGFFIDADGVTLIGNTATNNGNHGFKIHGDANASISNRATNNGSNGFFILFRKNKLVSNTSTSNGDNGFFIDGDQTTVINNTANNNSNDGFAIFSGQRKFAGNRASANGNNGFAIFGGNNKLLRNMATDNGNDGFQIGDDSNRLTKNVAENNGGNGIYLIPGAFVNRIIKNVASGHLDPNFDLRDDNSGVTCPNTWKNNTFVTKGGSGVGCIH